MVQAGRRVAQLGPEQVVPRAHAAGPGGTQRPGGARPRVRARQALLQRQAPRRVAGEAGQQDVVQVQRRDLPAGIVEQARALAAGRRVPVGAVARARQRGELARGEERLVEGERDGRIAVKLFVGHAVADRVALAPAPQGEGRRTPLPHKRAHRKPEQTWRLMLGTFPAAFPSMMFRASVGM